MHEFAFKLLKVFFLISLRIEMILHLKPNDINGEFVDGIELYFLYRDDISSFDNVTATIHIA